MWCTNCGTQLAVGTNFCPKCGQKVEPEEPKKQFCTKCGQELPEGAEFCAHCGQKVAQEQENELVDKVKDYAQEKVEGFVQEKIEGLFAASEAEPAAQAANAAAGHISAQTNVYQTHNVSTSVQPAAQRRSAPPVPVSSAPKTAAPAATLSNIGAGAARAVSQATAAGAQVAVQTASAGVKKAGSTAKRIAAFTLVIVFIAGAISAWLGVFVSGPEVTVETFFSALEDYDIDTMLSCMDPKLEGQIRAIWGLTGGLVGSIIGIDIDFEALITIFPMFKDYLDVPDLGYHVKSCEVVLFSDTSNAEILSLAEKANSNGGSGLTGQYDSNNDIVNFLQKYHISIPGVEKTIAKTAIVKVTFRDMDGAMFVPMQNIGKGDWRMLIDATDLSKLS